ncbi:hypothetical protein P3L10_027159 [Capsicum annuum]
MKVFLLGVYNLFLLDLVRRKQEMAKDKVARQVAAPRSDGIKGNAQFVGTRCQNMKRKNKGESIRSQSLAQQDEPVQQKNSHEAGETIPTEPLCKRIRFYSRKTLPPDEPSPIPSTSAFPTRSTPANEDRTKADIQHQSPPRPPLLTKMVRKAESPPQSLGFSADQSSLIEDKISTMQKKSTRSAEILATGKGEIERLLVMPSEDLLLPKNCSALSEALSIYAVAPDLSAERVLALEKLKENLPHLSLKLCSAKKVQEEYRQKAAKKVLLIDELTKD